MATARPATPPPLRGCLPLFDAAAMRDADRRAREDHHIPGILLMERAGLASAHEILERFAGHRGAVVAVGRGNNGGDGWVVARHLADAGWAVEVVAPGGEGPSTADARAMAAVAESLGIRARPLDPARLAAGDRVVVDALLGTGARGAPRGPVADAVAAVAAAPGPVVSLDVPSGVDPDTGRVPGAAVRADLTVSYHGDMIGLHVEPGRGHAGRVVVADIGIPAAVSSAPAAWLAGAGSAAAIPRRAAGGDKYQAGAVLVVAGSPGLTGAGALACRAALRCGAGLVVAAVPRSVQPIVAAGLVEVMVAPIDDESGALGPASVAPVMAQAARVGAVVIGPGLGRAEPTGGVVRELLAAVALPVVLDADGLWHLGPTPGPMDRRAPTVITPHAGEAARLLGRDRAEVEADRLAAARELAAATGATCVLKGPGTIVAEPGGAVVVVGTGSSALSTAGTGDVLSGVVGTLLAKGMPAPSAAAAGAAAHGRAGEIAGVRWGDGAMAGDVVEALPVAIGGG